MSTPADRNRLEEEASPYLRQHADNPVDWQPWDDDALAAARERDVPIFLSVGYAACHWCHVMEEESFVDEAVAERLNEDFVPIKVDREERPDLDRIYQTACQLLSGRGGWPLSVWLTPDGEPFHVGTYFPRESRGGVPGFLDLLDDVADSWADPEDRADLEARADRVASHVRSELQDTPDAASDDVAAPMLGTQGDSNTATTDADGATTEPEDAVDVGAAPGGATGAEQAPGPVERAAAAAVRSADREHGGWGSGPKFPQPTRIDVLFDAGAAATIDDADEQDEYHAVARGALAAMVDGGLYDHVGGGFHRYCTDREWVVPHFEKMLYDNAEIPRVLLAGYQVSGRERYATVASETFAFLDRELAQPDRGPPSSARRTSSDEPRESDSAFASTLDARSPVPPERTEDDEPGEHEEGEFYVWTPEEVATALDGVDAVELLEGSHSSDDGGDSDVAESDLADLDLADLVCERYGITEAGNFEGATVLTVDVSLQDLAADRGPEPATVRDLLDGARERLRAVREERPRPRRDDKVIGAWNGLAIRALAEGAIVLEDESLGERAREALEAVRDRLWDGDSLARRYVLEDADDAADVDGDDRTDGDAGASTDRTADVRGEGYLEDYAFLGRGALACYEATGEVEPLAFAIELAEEIVDQFYDVNAGTLYFTPESGESLIARPQEARDQSTPSSLGVGADLLAALDAFVPHDRFGDAAERVVRTHAGSLDGSPLEHPSLALAAERVRSGSTEVTVAAGAADGAGFPAEWRSWLADTFLPRRLLAPRPATDDELESWLDQLGLDAAPPIWAGREGGDHPTAYVCRGFTCSRPLQEPADADAWLAE